jgi:hypothetical protein
VLALAGAAAHACGTDAPRLEPWTAADGARLWWVCAERGEADERNRGRVSNLLVVRDGARVWLVGSGPSRAFGRALGCAVERATGLPVSDVISPWPRPELVLGATGLPRARHWAHADVARAMRVQCARCVSRLRQRLGAAASDLARAARLPERRLHGASGRLGPFDWWRVERAAGVPVTLWRVRSTGVLTAPGLVWNGDAPDLRDSDVASMREATAKLAAIAAAAGTSAILGEQGEPAGASEVEAHQRYWQALDAAVRDALEQARDATDVPRTLPGVDPARTAGNAHALNWHRAWRHAEDAAFKQPAPRR